MRALREGEFESGVDEKTGDVGEPKATRCGQRFHGRKCRRREKSKTQARREEGEKKEHTLRFTTPSSTSEAA